MIRLFVGIELAEDVRQELAALCAGVPNARWVSPESLHVTLRFIGEVDQGVAQDVHDRLSDLQAPSFALALAGVGTFGSGRHPHTLWVGVERSAELEHLRDKVESAVVRAGLTPEARKFSPHLTLARFREAPGPRLGDFLGRHALFRLPPLTVGHFTLFSSHLGRGGAVYAAEAEYPLEGGAPAGTCRSPRRTCYT
jgi:2'-5' RNA ligase